MEKGKKENKRFDKFFDLVDKINHIPVLMAVRQGLALTIPIMIVGSLATFINFVPIPAYQDFMQNAFGENWRNLGIFMQQATFSIVALVINLAVGYSLATYHSAKHQIIHPVMGALVSLAGLMAISNLGDSPSNVFAASGIFIALFTAIVATQLYVLLCQVPYLRINLHSNAADRFLHVAVTTLIPFAITVGIFALVNIFFQMAGVENIHEAMYASMANIFRSSNSQLWNAVAVQFLIHISWFFGIHGNNAFNPVLREYFVPGFEKNVALVAEGLAPTEILTNVSFNAFVNLGGAGATLCLIAAIFIGARRSNTRRVVTVGLLPSLINVNEIVIFGVPVALNFYLLIPFIMAPITLTVTSYLAMAMGLVPLTVESVRWTTPILLSGYEATGGHISGSILQLFNLIVGTLIYLPFIRMHEHSLSRDNKRRLGELTKVVNNIDELRRTVLLDRSDVTGNMARALAQDLKVALHSKELELHYQPLVNKDKKVFCAEALLRWNHSKLGRIAPPVVVLIADESGQIHELGMWIFRTAITALRGFRDSGVEINMSINITPSQLDDPALVEKVIAIVDELGVKSQWIDIEVTEQMALGGLDRMQVLTEFREAGFHVALDDFGMGHGSLTYLKDLNMDILKIDGAIIRDLETNPSCRDIIATIAKLGESMNMMVIAEFVENEEQRNILLELGCRHYQGYLYSPALPYYEALDYMTEMDKEAKNKKYESETE